MNECLFKSEKKSPGESNQAVEIWTGVSGVWDRLKFERQRRSSIACLS